MRRSSFVLLSSAALSAGLLSTTARAQSSEGFDKKGDDAIAAQKQADAEKGSKMPGEKDKPKAEVPAEPPTSLVEDPMKSYYYVNLRFRDIVIPKFMFGLFAAGGANVNAPSVGLELTRRKDHTEFDIALSYADYSHDWFLFKNKSDPDTSFELAQSTLKLVYFTVDLLYEIPIDDQGKWAFLIGGGVGFAGVAGSLYREWAYPIAGNNPDSPTLDPSLWARCGGVNNGPPLNSGVPYCGNNGQGRDMKNQHLNGYSEKSWANGGSLPMVFPWIALPQISVRFKPIKSVQLRADVGFSTSGFYFGMSGGYGLPVGGLAENAAPPAPKH